MYKVKKKKDVATSDFWYDLFEGGYLDPVELLKKQEDVDEVLKAMEVLLTYRKSLEEAFGEGFYY